MRGITGSIAVRARTWAVRVSRRQALGPTCPGRCTRFEPGRRRCGLPIDSVGRRERLGALRRRRGSSDHGCRGPHRRERPSSIRPVARRGSLDRCSVPWTSHTRESPGYSTIGADPEPTSAAPMLRQPTACSHRGLFAQTRLSRRIHDRQIHRGPGSHGPIGHRLPRICATTSSRTRSPRWPIPRSSWCRATAERSTRAKAGRSRLLKYAPRITPRGGPAVSSGRARRSRTSAGEDRPRARPHDVPPRRGPVERPRLATPRCCAR